MTKDKMEDFLMAKARRETAAEWRQPAFGTEIAARRDRLSKTQVQAAARFGVTGNTYARWERGESLPDAPGAILLAFDALDAEHALAVEPLVEALEQKIESLQEIRQRLSKKRKA